VRLQYRGADWMVRTDAAQTITALFRQAHVALPPRARQTAPPKPTAPSKPAPKRRGRPKRSASPASNFAVNGWKSYACQNQVFNWVLTKGAVQT
jgi:hypothetical protein